MAKPVLTSADYNGSQLYMEWQVELPPRFTGFQIDLDDSNGGKQSFTTSNTYLKEKLDLSSSLTYTATIIVMVQDQPSSSSDPSTLISSAPLLYRVAYTLSPNKLCLNWQAAQGKGAAGIEAYIATLTEVGKNNWNQSTEGNSTTFDKSLSSSESYTSVVRGANELGNILGPPSTVYNPIVETPIVLSVVYDIDPKDVLTLRWNAVSGADILYTVVLQDVGHSSWSPQTTDLTLDFDKSLDSSKQYTVQVQVSDSTGVVWGPSSKVYIPICVAPELSMVSYDTGVLDLKWDAAVGEGVEAYEAALVKPGADKWYSDTDGLETQFNKNLDEQETYQTSVRATDQDQIVFGPSSDVLIPLLTSATDFNLIYTGTKISTSWVNDSNPAVTGYLVELDKNGAQEAQNTATDSPSDFDETLSDGSVYKARIRSTAPKLQGPWSSWVYAPYAQSISYAYDDYGRLLSQAWNSVSTVSYVLDGPGNIQTRVFSDS